MTVLKYIMQLGMFLLFPLLVTNVGRSSSYLVILDKEYDENTSNVSSTVSNSNNSYILVDDSNPFTSISALLQLQAVPNVVLISSSLCDSLIHTYLSDIWKYSTVLCTWENNIEPEAEAIVSNTTSCCTRLTPQPGAAITEITVSSTRVPIGKVLSEILLRNKWSSAIVLHDAQPESETIVHELTATLSLQTRLTMFVIMSTERGSVRQLLTGVHTSETIGMKNFLLICSESTMINILSEASQMDDRITGIITMSSWVVLLPKSRRHIVEEISPRLDNLVVISYPTIFKSLYWQRIPEISSRNLSTVNRMLSNTTDLKWYGSIQTLLYKENGRVLSPVASFDISGQVEIYGSIFPNIKNGFNGRMLIAATKEYNPFVYVSRNGLSVAFEGLCVDLLSNLSEALNFTFQIIEPPDDQWGTYKNESWDGLIRQLQFNEVDLVVAPLTVREDRETVMDFTYPYFYDAAGAIFKRPGLRRWTTLLRPFKWEVLLCLGVVVFCMILLLFVMEKGRRMFFAEFQNTMKDENRVLEESFLYIWGTVLKHGSNHQPRSISGCVLVIFVSLFCIIMSAAYCGNLIAFFTITRESVPFRTSTGITEQSEYTWGTINGSLWQLQIANSNHSDFQKLWQGIRRFSQTDPDVLASSSKVHKKKVEEGNYVFFFDRSVMEIWAQENCQLTLLDETFRQITFGVGLPNHSPYLKTFSKVLMEFEKAGLLSLLKKKWWPDVTRCAEDQVQVKTRVIELEDLQSAFYVLLIGIALAAVLLVVEYFKHSLRSTN